MIDFKLVGESQNDLVSEAILAGKEAERGKGCRVALESLEKHHEGFEVFGVFFVLQLSAHLEHEFFVDHQDAQVMDDFESEPFVVDFADDLQADGPAKFIPLLDHAKFPQDLLRPIL